MGGKEKGEISGGVGGVVGGGKRGEEGRERIDRYHFASFENFAMKPRDGEILLICFFVVVVFDISGES
jgi:hypothetical protein